MPRYNTERDNRLDEMISRMNARLDRLERSTKMTTVVTVRASKASDFNTPVTVTSSTFVDTHVFTGIYLGHTPVVRILATCSDPTTAGEFRIVDGTGNALTSITGAAVTPKAIPAGTELETPFENDQSVNYWLDLPVGSDLLLKLQVRKTAGAGSIDVRVKYLVQIPS